MDPNDDFERMRVHAALSAVTITDLILDAAVAKLDTLFGKGFAKANPALVASYLETTAQSVQTDLETAAYGGPGDGDFDDMLDEFDGFASHEKEH